MLLLFLDLTFWKKITFRHLINPMRKRTQLRLTSRTKCKTKNSNSWLLHTYCSVFWLKSLGFGQNCISSQYWSPFCFPYLIFRSILSPVICVLSKFCKSPTSSYEDVSTGSEAWLCNLLIAIWSHIYMLGILVKVHLRWTGPNPKSTVGLSLYWELQGCFLAVVAEVPLNPGPTMWLRDYVTSVLPIKSFLYWNLPVNKLQ